jgi:hypothetical protein
MTRPTLTVEIAFDSTYSTPAVSRTWTDVTAYVLTSGGVGVDFGRQDEFDQAGPNTCSLTLNNSDGRFTPGLTTGAYYPDVKIGRPLRVTVDTGSGDVDRFVGYIDEWPLEWPAAVDTFATASITASSRMARMGLSAKLRSVVETEILLDAPDAYYTMGEAEGATRAIDSSGNAADALSARGGGTQPPVFGTATGPGTDGLTAVQFNTSTRALQGDLALDTFAGVGFFFSYSAAPAAATDILILDDDEPSKLQVAVRVTVLASGILEVDPEGGVGTATSSMAVTDGETRHVFIKQNGADLELYIDGVLDDSTPGAAGSYAIVQLDNSDPTTTLAVAHLALFNTAPSAARIADHAAAGLTGFADETAADRLARYAGYAGIPTAEQDFDIDALTLMAHIDTTDQGVVELMQTVATTDGGALYDAPDGTSTYVARTGRYNATAGLTLNVATGEVEVGYQPKVDRSAMVNTITATLSDGTYSAPAQNATSVTEYGAHGPGDLELATTDADEAHAAAWWRVNTYGEPSARAPQLGVELAKMNTARQDAVLAVTVGDKITVTNLPDQSDSASKSFFVEGWTETITDTLHRIEFNVSPATGFDVWEIEHATFGQYDAYPIAY